MQNCNNPQSAGESLRPSVIVITSAVRRRHLNSWKVTAVSWSTSELNRWDCSSHWRSIENKNKIRTILNWSFLNWNLILSDRGRCNSLSLPDILERRCPAESLWSCGTVPPRSSGGDMRQTHNQSGCSPKINYFMRCPEIPSYDLLVTSDVLKPTEVGIFFPSEKRRYWYEATENKLYFCKSFCLVI